LANISSAPADDGFDRLSRQRADPIRPLFGARELGDDGHLIAHRLAQRIDERRFSGSDRSTDSNA
jgi:hypothetical protein